MKGKKTLSIVILVIAGLAAYKFRTPLVDAWENLTTKDIPAVSYDDIRNTTPTVNQEAPTNSGIPVANTNTTQPEPKPELPASFNLDVPFTTQAPFANWDEEHEEFCEEASALTVHYYYQGKTFTKDIAEQELQRIKDFENGYFGFYKDTTAEQTAELMKEYWGYTRVDVEYDPSIEDIKTHIAAGRPVIVPTAGRQLGNPNFKAPGPLYHMLVVRGYSSTQFITNDVGTRKGENYRYEYDVIMNAMHDWNGGDVDNGQKAIIIVYPND